MQERQWTCYHGLRTTQAKNQNVQSTYSELFHDPVDAEKYDWQTVVEVDAAEWWRTPLEIATIRKDFENLQDDEEDQSTTASGNTTKSHGNLKKKYQQGRDQSAVVWRSKYVRALDEG
jgi:hypothetical protein